MVEVTAIDIDSVPMVSAERRLQDVQDVLEICSSLVTATDEWHPDPSGLPRYGSCVRLAHYSVKEYFTSDRIGEGHATEYSIQDTISDECLANDCIAYLSYLDGEKVDAINHVMGNRYPLSGYALDYWNKHAFIAEHRTGTAVRLGPRFLLRVSKTTVRLGRPSLFESPESVMESFMPRSIIHPQRTAKRLIGDEVSSNDFKANQTVLLKLAVGRGYLTMVILLHEHGATSHNESLLYHAVRFSCLDIVDFYLARGADINARDKEGDTALMKNIKYGRNDIVSLLLQRGADVNARNKQGDTALIYASILERYHMIRLLLQGGADVNARDKEGDTALMKSIKYGHNDIVSLLLQRRADVNARNKQGDTALIYASMLERYYMIRLLLKGGADVNARDGGGRTALHVASAYGNYYNVSHLLRSGADVDARNEDGDTALVVASRKGIDDARDILLGNGADINSENFTIEAISPGSSYHKTVALLRSARHDIT
ncbi:MAG: hypothetical protein Q9182_000769 [Xanthomendoza sp. 2 TL-2023]